MEVCVHVVWWGEGWVSSSLNKRKKYEVSACFADFILLSLVLWWQVGMLG